MPIRVHCRELKSGGRVVFRSRYTREGVAGKGFSREAELEFLIWFLAWGIVCGAVASNRGRSPILWFIIGAAISPLALIVLLTMPNLEIERKSEQEAAARRAEASARQQRETIAARELRDCPYCAEPIKRQAKLCRHCGKEGVIAESVPNPTLSGIEEHRARIAEGPEAVLERFRWPNVVAIEGDVFPAERRDMSNVIIGNDLAA